MKLNHDFAMSVETILYLKEREPNDFIQAKEIAKTLNFSVGYLQKVVQTLSRHGILECKRGRIGGVKLRAKIVTLLDLWQATCGGLEFTSPPLAVMEKPLKAFRESLSKVVICKRK
jgi:DNA-binding IscR family transcriptional regulator